ncbi:cupin family protein [Westerdykella ornata]|uniref:Cupin family protein n=1 Tax=Westerdykella ornata TaxID=318751 RepID=A0A6A6JC22_WESOR|nr:cupin family protein [Westerdykella ornata]KAF2273982.1 cupin family protein [Westerdykella ornata]
MAGIEKRSAEEVIQALNLQPNVEKGWFTETYRDATSFNNRSYSTAIYYLLEGSVGSSYWHRVDAAEVWHYYAGSPLILELSYDDGKPTETHLLGPNIFENQRPQVVVEKHQWQRARSLGDWTLVGTTVAPGFVESGFELAPPDWEPKRGPGNEQ